MNAAWVVAGLAVAGVVIAILTTWQRRRDNADLGAVSHRWIAEQRAGQTGDSHR